MSCCHGAAIYQSFCSQLIARHSNPNPPAAKATRLSTRKIHCVQCKQQHSCYCTSEDDVLLQLITFSEVMHACVYRVAYCWAWDAASSQVSLPSKQEDAIALPGIGIMHMLHVETNISKYRLHPLTKIGPLWEEKNLKTLFRRFTAVYMHFQVRFELMGPRSTISTLK